MLHMEDNPIITWLEEIGIEKGIKKGIEQGIEQGRIQSLQQTLLEIIAARFPSLQEQAKAYTHSLNDANKFQSLIVQLSIVQSADEAQRLFTNAEK